MMIPGSNMADGGGMGATPKLNNNQFGNVVKGAALATPVGAGLAAGAAVAKAAPKAAKAAAPVAVKAAGNVAKAGAGALGSAAGAARAIAPAAARTGAIGAMANPVGAGLAAAGGAAYGASKTPGGKSIIKGAVKGAGGPNMGVPGPVGAAAGAIKGAVTSQGAKNVASGAAKGGLIGALGGPVGAIAGTAIGGIAGLFSHRGMGGKPKAATGSPVPNRATPYTVQKGDTLTSIAKAKGTSVEALRKANPKFMEKGSKYNNGNMIWSGTKVNLK